MIIDKYKNAQIKFQKKVRTLVKRRDDVFTNVSEKIDKKQLENIRKNIKNYE